MEITSLHKYISLINLADGSTEVMFAGQPCLYTFSSGEGSGYCWRINPVFAKLTYGANIFSDVPFCTQSFDSVEEAIADGLDRLHTIGAFNTEVDLPDDTYANPPTDDTVETAPGQEEIKEAKEEPTGEIERDLIYVINKATGTVLKKFPRSEADKAEEVAAETPGHVAVTGSQIVARGLKEDVAKFYTGKNVMEHFNLMKKLQEALDKPIKSVPDTDILDKLLAGKDLEPAETAKVMTSLASGEPHYVDKETGLPLINQDVKSAMVDKATNPPASAEVEQPPVEEVPPTEVPETETEPKKTKGFVSKYAKPAQIEERINKPQGHKETPDPISDDSEEGTGRVKKMMGNKAPIQVIANILARKK